MMATAAAVNKDDCTIVSLNMKLVVRVPISKHHNLMVVVAFACSKMNFVRRQAFGGLPESGFLQRNA